MLGGSSNAVTVSTKESLLLVPVLSVTVSVIAEDPPPPEFVSGPEEIVEGVPVVAEVRDILLQEFDVDLEQCEGDLLTLLHTLCGRRLIVMEELVNG